MKGGTFLMRDGGGSPPRIKEFSQWKWVMEEAQKPY